MRGTFWIAVVAACLGFLLASVTTFAYTRANIWLMQGPEFRLGYVIGYLDAVSLAQRKDPRAMLPVRGKNFDRWVKGVDDFFADGANADRTVPDGMSVVGNKIRAEWAVDWARKTGEIKPSPSPSAGP
jgi:hypothetical protein